MPRKKKAKNEAQKLLKSFKASSAPINLINLLNFIDLEYIAFEPRLLSLKDIDSTKVSAFIEYSTNTIMFNKSHPRTRLRFSIAHEIGHYQLKHQSFPHELQYDPKSSVEIEANIFAAELLMPSFLINKEIIKTQEDIKHIAEKYQVSFEAADLRIRLDKSLVPSGYDFQTNQKSSVVEDSLQAIDDSIEYFPPYEGYIDDYNEAYEYYTTNNIEDEELKDTLEVIEGEGLENLYPFAYKALLDIVNQLKEE